MTTIMTADPTCTVASTKNIRISQRFSAATVKQASRFSFLLGTDVCDVQIGVINHDNPDRIERRVLTVPMRRLLNGKQIDCIRTIRFNVLLNIITSWAKEAEGIDLTQNSVVFLGFGIPA